MQIADLVRTLFSSLAIGVTLVSCAAPDETDGANRTLEGDGPVQVVVTTGMIGDIVRKVGGDDVQVQALMGSGVDPHLYQASSEDVRELENAELIFYNGLHLEGKMGEVLEHVGENRPVVAVTDELPKGYLLNAQGQHDPHVWMDPNGWISATGAVADELARFDPARAEDYHRRAEAYLVELHKLDDYARGCIASIPESRRVLVTAHDAFNYLGRAYGLDVRGIQGISTESEAGLRDLEELVSFLVDQKIPAVFVESSVPHKSVEALVEGAHARGHAVEIGGELFSDAMGISGTYEGTYIGMIDHNLTLVTRSLGGEAPARGLNGELAE